jgi:hypothetical protein
MSKIKLISLSLAVLCFFYSLAAVAFMLPSWPMILFWTGCMLWLFGVVYGIVMKVDELSNEPTIKEKEEKKGTLSNQKPYR